MEASPRRQVWISDGDVVHRGLTWTDVKPIFFACDIPPEKRRKTDLRSAKPAVKRGELRFCKVCAP